MSVTSAALAHTAWLHALHCKDPLLYSGLEQLLQDPQGPLFQGYLEEGRQWGEPHHSSRFQGHDTHPLPPAPLILIPFTLGSHHLGELPVVHSVTMGKGCACRRPATTWLSQVSFQRQWHESLLRLDDQGSYPAKLVTLLLICWTLDVRSPKCPGGQRGHFGGPTFWPVEPRVAATGSQWGWLQVGLPPCLPFVPGPLQPSCWGQSTMEVSVCDTAS